MYMSPPELVPPINLSLIFFCATLAAMNGIAKISTNHAAFLSFPHSGSPTNPLDAKNAIDIRWDDWLCGFHLREIFNIRQCLEIRILSP